MRQPTPSPPPVGPSSGETPATSGTLTNAGSESNGIDIPASFAQPPPAREVARGVSNLGNTCYMNPALQALAHAPELCYALDVESHVRSCPIALRNERRRRKRREEACQKESDITTSEEPGAGIDTKGHRRCNSGSSAESKSSSKSSKKKKKKKSGRGKREKKKKKKKKKK